MSVEADDPREALFVFCLLSCRLVSPPQAIKEWIPDDEPDLDWFHRPRNPSDPDPDWFDQLGSSFCARNDASCDLHFT